MVREQELIAEINQYRKVYIYGAGMVGSLLIDRLGGAISSEEPIEFVVSNPMPYQSYLGHRVYGISDVVIHNDCIVIVGVLPRNQKQIINMLHTHGIERYIAVDDELYEDMERNYISDYLQTHDLISGDRDILFMSSDNNYSSGAFLCMVDLCVEMIATGIKPLVVLPGFGNAEQILMDNGIEYTFIQSRSGLIEKGKRSPAPSMNAEAIEKTENLIEKFKIKLVHNNSNHGYTGAVAARNKRIPYIWHIRENIYEQGFEFFDELFFRNLINDSEFIVTVSNYVGNCYPCLDDSRVKCIYDGVQTDKYYRKRKIMQNNKIRILMPGIMVPLKGQHQLVEAAALLKKDHISFDISFVGSGDADYIRGLENAVEDNELNECVHFHERVNNLEEWYERSDVVVVCSRSEAFGRVTVEAQLSGCIVIGAACGATIELIEDGVTGYLYDLDDAEMLKEKIVLASTEKKITACIAENGQKSALNKFDKSVNCKRIIREYECVLGKIK